MSTLLLLFYLAALVRALLPYALWLLAWAWWRSIEGSTRPFG